MRSSYLLILFLLVASLVTGLPGGASKAWAENPGVQTKPDGPTGSSGFNLGTWLIGIYRENISPVDGDRCPSLPSCSSYSLQAMKKHGFFIGWMMTVDRLIHEGTEETRVSPVVYSEGKWKIFDPVENNDYWWSSPDRNQHD
jgi:hypothetical protein